MSMNQYYDILTKYPRGRGISDVWKGDKIVA